jgi:hypothetical protein
MTEDYFSHLLPSIGGALADFYDSLTPWLLFGLALIIADLRFGIKKAAKRGEEIRGSTAWRRTINKMADYFCWVTLAGLCGRSVGVVLGIPVVSMALLLIIYGIEISSCLNNYFEYKGIKKRFNFFKLIGRKEIDDALEDIPDKPGTKPTAETEIEE